MRPLAIPASARAPTCSRLSRTAIKQILKAGKFAGILTDEAMAQHWINAGAGFVGIGSDVGILARGAEAMAAKFKKSGRDRSFVCHAASAAVGSINSRKGASISYWKPLAA